MCKGMQLARDWRFSLLRVIFRNMKAMLLSVIELRASDWGREPDDPSGGSTQTGNTLSNTSQVSSFNLHLACS